MITCKQVENLVTPYINGELSDDQLEEFLEHLEDCPHCRDELETYYIVDVGLKQLDTESAIYDIKGNLELAIETSKQWLYYKKIRKIIYYSVSTLCFYSVLVMIFLQVRIWLQNGI